MLITYGNMQRAGVALNMTLAEAENASEVKSDGESLLRVVVKEHKTSSTYGPAIIYIKKDMPSFNCYLSERQRKNIDSELFLLRSNGTPYDKHYMRFVQALVTSVGYTRKVPTPTEGRKAGATVARESFDDGEMEAVSRHMTHSSSTSEKYYRDKHCLKRSVKGYKLIQSVTKQHDPPASFTAMVLNHFKSEIESGKTPTLTDC